METTTMTMKSKIEQAFETTNTIITIKDLFVGSTVKLLIGDLNYNHVTISEDDIRSVSLIGDKIVVIEMNNSATIFVYTRNFSVVL